jgi:hypothetical protein
MGLFGSKKVHTTESYTTPLLANSDDYGQLDSGTSGGVDRPWPSLIRQTVASSIVGNRSLSNDLMESFMNGIFVKSRAMYSYGRRGDNPSVAGGFVRGLPTGKTVYTPSGSPSQVKAIIEKETGEKVFLAYNLIDEEDDGELWYDVEYYVLDNRGNITGDLIPWRYQASTEVYPSLTPKGGDEAEVSPYFPIVPIRERNQRIKETDPELYKTGRHTLRTIGVDFDRLDESIHDGENTDLGFLDHAYVIVAVDIATKVPNSNIYLFDYFNTLYYESGVKSEDYEYWFENVKDVDQNDDPEVEEFLPPPPPINRLEVSDGNYKMVLGWQYITKELKTGVVAKKNQVHKEVISNLSIEFGDQESYRAYRVNRDVLVLQKQISDTQYMEIQVAGLVHTNYIGSAKKTIDTTLSEAFARNEDKNNFVIPLRQDVLKHMGSIKGHDLMYDSVRLVVNSHESNKLKWYQTGLFKVAVVIVAVAVTVFSAGTAGMTAAQIAGLVMSTIATTVVTMLVVEVGLKMITDFLGPELALVAAVAYAIYTGDFDKVSAYVTTAETMVSGLHTLTTFDALEKMNKEMLLLNELLEDITQEEEARTEGIIWTMGVIDDTSYTLRQPNAFIEKKKMEPRTDIELAQRTHLFIDQMQFTDRPYSHIKLGLKPTQA